MRAVAQFHARPPPSALPAHQDVEDAESTERNNANRDAVHDAEFRQSERDWYSFVERLTEKLVEIDDTVPELPVKDVVGLLDNGASLV